MKKDINLFHREDSIYLKKIKSKSEISKEDSCEGYLIESSEAEARRIIDSLKKSGKIIAFVGGDDYINRRAVETLKINYLVSPEKNCKYDNLKQRDSGLNHVVAKEAAKKGIKILINFNEIKGLSKKEKIFRIEKIIQNIKICQKAKCELKIASLGLEKKEIVGEKERMAFGISLGMSSLQAKKSVFFD